MSSKLKTIITIVVTAIIVGGGVYYWQQNKTITDTTNIPKTTQEMNTQSEKTTEETVATATQPSTTDKTFEGNGFSFLYPSQYIADAKGIWTEEGYKLHLNNEICSTCHLPEVEVISTITDGSLDKQIISDFDLPGETLEETGVSYEKMKIGDNDFIKIRQDDLFDITGYYTKNNNQILAFQIYWSEKDNQELKDLISTLRFK
jgi:hypothetical protein